jgi:cytochrome b561
VTATAASARARYTGTAIGLHWIVVVLIVAAWTLGLTMVDLPLSPQKLRTYSWHKWTGVTIFLLALARLAWRAAHRPPALPASMPAWQARAAAASHALLYALLLAIPLSGWLFSSASGVPVVYLGLVQLPDLVGKDKALAELLKQVHVALNWALFVIACVHVAAGLKHHFIDRDDVLARMLPFVSPRREGDKK